ncbi:hypothetical protein SDRG_15671 [Saprolegnia diclina VS20]|uniref:EF-hand domain-containing protein n=1 Tax=Saprolegnia diclina (strain VS20) TaxID=1156394 RepID=T0R392_SAPDV|nr:hypothetical protein SDRG_15671 [Saprolegnia diclina VS20]EQC26493.1 hypothetical protein SDRG_15671 [Saprolegnia diclina VS20]|eukprot:XP_008620072.1 hypothetical protein SDRG_15671 [Saprolegnia diclina VS20]
MGGRYSKGPIRKDARPLLPAAWNELVALERWLSVNNVLFVTDLATLQAWMPAKDVSAAKRVFTYPFCALDLLGAFALLQHGAPTTRKLEFVGHLLKNGPDCNKPELLIAMGYVVRGVARLKGLPTVPDATLQFVARQVFGGETQLPWSVVVAKLIVLPDIIYFLSDLDMVSVDSLETLIGEQAHLMQELAKVEHDLAVLGTTTLPVQQMPTHRHGWLFHVGLDLYAATATVGRRTSQTPMQINIDECARMIFKHFNAEPRPVVGSGAKKHVVALEAKRSFRHPADFVAFLATISDGTVQLPLAEASPILQTMPRDQLERIYCSDMIRWFKHWALAQNHRGHMAFDQTPLWKHAAKIIKRHVQSYMLRWDALRGSVPCGPRPSSRLLMDEAQYSVLVKIDPPLKSTMVKPVAGIGGRLDLVFHDEAEGADGPPLVHLLEAGYPTVLSLELFVFRDVNEATATRLAFLVSEFLNDYNVLEGLSGLYDKAVVTVMNGLREHSVADAYTIGIASDKLYLQINLLSQRNIVAEIEEMCQAPLRDVVDKLHCEVQLGNAWSEIVQHAKDMRALFEAACSDPTSSASASLLRLLFDQFDRNGSGALELDELNALQQSRGLGVVYSDEEFRALLAANGELNDSSPNGLSWQAFLAHFTTNGGVFDSVQQLGGLNTLLHGSISWVLAINRHWLLHLEANAATSVWRNRFLKWSLLLTQYLTDVTVELSFPNALSCARYLWPSVKTWPVLEAPYWLANQLYDLSTLFWHAHTEPHTADEAGCLNLLCAARSSLSKLGHMRSSKQQAVASETFEMESIRKFLEAYPALEAAVCGIQQLSVVTRPASFKVELDHCVVAKAKP